MNRKGPHSKLGTDRPHSETLVARLWGGRIQIGLVGVLLGAGLTALFMSGDNASRIGSQGAEVSSKDGSVVGTSVLLNESVCNQKTPIASITIDGETIELFITPSQ